MPLTINNPVGNLPPRAFGVNEGAADNTVAINRWLQYHKDKGLVPNWGSGGSYIVAGNLTNFNDQRQDGVATLNRSGADFHIGSGNLTSNVNTVFVSPTGLSTNDGLTSDYPVDLSTAFSMVRVFLSMNPNQRFRLDLDDSAPYTSVDTVRFENWPQSAHRIEILGKYDSGNSRPSVVIDGTGNPSNWLRVLRDCSNLSLDVADVSVENFGSDGIYLECDSMDVLFYRVDFKNNGGAGFHSRGGHVTLLGPATSEGNAGSGIVMQGQYGTLGNKGNPSSGYLLKNNGGAGAHFSRGTVAYCSYCVFEGNSYSIGVDKNSRVRRQSNTHTSWTQDSAIRVGPNCTLDYDPDALDTFPGLTSGKSAIENHGGFVSGVRSEHAGTLQPHNSQLSSHSVSNTDEWFDIGLASDGGDPELAPYRMPDTWMFNTNARGELLLRCTVDANCGLGVKLSGDSSSTSITEFYLPAHSDTAQWLIKIRHTGPQTSNNYGRVIVEATRASTKTSGVLNATEHFMEVSQTGSLSTGGTRGNSGLYERWRLMFKMDNVTSTFTLNTLESWVAE